MSNNSLLRKLENEELIISGRLIDASNATLFGHLKDDESLKIIYKPVAGERPLWDFPDGSLAAREFAAYLFSEIFDFHLVPETVLREGPFGFGMVQRWIEDAQPENLIEIAQATTDEIRRMIFFDSLINNADRKYGHILIGPDRKIFGCDHGITFHSEDKLRTVLWQFSGDHLTETEIQLLNKVVAYKYEEFRELLSKNEIEAIALRAKKMLNDGRLPAPAIDRPAIPWPPV
jgi:uncharacterized repeat protein (TIGR03843 family)